VNKSAKSIIQFVIFLAIGALMVWLSLKQVSPHKDEVLNAFREADYFWVVVSLIISVFSHFLRAYRWNYLLKPLNHEVKLLNANCHVLVGYFANYIPPRIGEVIRCTLAAKYDKIPFQIGFGTVITERIVDTFVFLIIFVITLFVQFSNLIGLANYWIFDPLSQKLGAISQSPTKMIILGVFCLICLVAFIFFRKKMSNMFKGKFGNILKGFGEGLGSIRKMDKPWTFVILSLLIWLSYLLSLYFCFFAISGTSNLTLSEALTLLLFGTIGVIVSPGGAGIYQIMLTEILLHTYHVEKVAAIALPWLSWGSQFVLIAILGVISLIVLPLANRNKHVVSQPTQ
jgi:uncharacterized protein (TIRG00374 family)